MTSESRLDITYSQNLKLLAETWIDECFSPACNPFARRIVVVPHLPMKNFLLQSMLSHPRLQIAAGCTILPLHAAVIEMGGDERQVASSLELSLWIEEIFLRQRGVFGNSSVGDYVQKLLLSPRKLSSFCSEIARLFLDYATYGNEWLDTWLQKEGWQQFLWKEVHSVFASPSILLEQKELFSGQVYLFGFSTLPLSYLQFFSKQRACCYFFSPCAQFWADSLSRFEKKGLESLAKRLGVSLQTRNSLQEYLSHDHPLLANFGKVGRDFVKEIDTLSCLDEERYDLPPLDSLLHRLQHSLLANTREVFAYDDSIQIHSAATKLQELEVLEKTLARFLQENPEILPQEICVIVTDLPSYTPFIDGVFSHREIPYVIQGKIELRDADKGFLHLVEWPSHNFAIEDVKKIFSSSSVQQKWKLSLQEIERLIDLCSFVGIQQDLDGHPHSWQQGFDRMLYGLVLPEGTLIDPCPVSCISHTEIELVEKFSEWFFSFQKFCALFHEQRGMNEWLNFLIELFENFVSNEESRCLIGMKRIRAKVPFSSQPLFSFERAVILVRELCSQEEISSSLDRILFLSADSLHLPPAKIIWYLGADEELLPRLNVKMSLSELPSPISSVDRQRYLLIEAVMKAQERLIFSYERVSSEDGKEKRGSSFLEEFSPLIEGGEIPINYHEAPLLPSIKKMDFFDTPSRKKETAITLHALGAFAKNPLKFYLKETLGIIPPFSEDEQSRSFLLPSFEKKRILNGPVSIKQLQASGKLPQGRFSAVAKRELEEELQERKEILQSWGLQESDIYSLSLVKNLRISKENGKLPALSLPPFTLEGVLTGVTRQGLIVQGDLLSAWPLYLLYLILHPDMPYLLSLKERRRFEIKVEDAKGALQRYLEFYNEALSSCCPLMQGSFACFQKEDVEGFLSFCHKSEDPSLIYLRRHDGGEWLKEQFLFWQARVISIYAPFCEVLV